MGGVSFWICRDDGEGGHKARPYGWGAMNLRETMMGFMPRGWGSAYQSVNTDRKRTRRANTRSFAVDEDRAIGPYDREELRLDNRDMMRNVGAVFAGLMRFANGVVGTGVRPEPMTDDDDWNEAAKALYTMRCASVDARGRVNMRVLQRLAVIHRMLDGELLMVKRPDMKLMPIEAERLKTPNAVRKRKDLNVLEGIRLGKDDNPLGAYICNRKKANGTVDLDSYDYIKWEDLFYLGDPTRIDSLRSISPITSVIESLQMRGDYNLATLVKAKAESMRVWAIYEDENDEPPGYEDRNAGGAFVEPTTTGQTVPALVRKKLDFGEVWKGTKGEKIESVGNSTPGQQYQPFNESLLTDFAAVTGIPYEVLMLCISKASFAGARAMMEVAEHTWSQWRQWLIDDFIQRDWNWSIWMMIQKGMLPPPPVDKFTGISQWHRVLWIPPKKVIWDPRTDSESQRKELVYGTQSVSGILVGRGTTAREVFTQRRRDIVLAIEEAEKIKKATGVDVDWHEVMDLNQSISKKPAGGKVAGGEKSRAASGPADLGDDEPPAKDAPDDDGEE